LPTKWSVSQCVAILIRTDAVGNDGEVAIADRRSRRDVDVARMVIVTVPVQLGTRDSHRREVLTANVHDAAGERIGQTYDRGVGRDAGVIAIPNRLRQAIDLGVGEPVARLVPCIPALRASPNWPTIQAIISLSTRYSLNTIRTIPV
jgi:hypothetical protein